MGGEERLEVAATKAKRERWLSTVCKAKEIEEQEHGKKSQEEDSDRHNHLPA